MSTKHTFLKSLLALGLIVAATSHAVAQDDDAPASNASGTISKTTAGDGASTPEDGGTLVCEDQASTGSKIRRRSCHRETEAMRLEKQQQIDARHQSAVANSTAGKTQ
jgi:hypothetical protein